MKSIREQWDEQSRGELERALRWAGDAPTLARVLGVTPQVIWNWQNRGRISAEGAVLLEERSGGAFRKRALRPDVVEWWPANEA